MKLDMGKAWNDAVALLGGNFGLVATIVALFYFLPYFAIALLFPEIINPEQPEIQPGADPDAVFEAMSTALQAQYAASWPFLLGLSIAQYVGSIAVLALFSGNGNPTVGDALKTGLRGTPTYIATQILLGLGLGAIIGLLVALAFVISPILGVLVGFVAVIAAIYVAIKLILVPAIIGMDGDLNPISVMKRSWALTKGNSLLIFAFLVVLFLVIGLISLVVTLVFSTVFAAFGDPVASIGTGLMTSLANAVSGGIFLVVLAAIHRQLSGAGDVAEAETFE